MIRGYMNFTLLLFLLVAVTGVWLRLFPFLTISNVPYTNVLHAHSHLALLGWAFLGVFVVFLKIIWQDLQQKNVAIWISFLLIIASISMTIAFLYQGYGGVAIFTSALHFLLELWAAFFIYKQGKKHPLLRPSFQLFITGAILSLIVSTAGTFTTAFVSAKGLKETALYEMGIYFYLHFLYNGWLTLIIIALFLMIFSYRKIVIHEKYVKIGFWFYFTGLFPSYLSNILWVEGTDWVLYVLSSIGVFTKWVGTLVIGYAFFQKRRQLKNHFSKQTRCFLVIILLLAIIKNTLEMGLIFPDLADLVYQTRNVIIAYLHLTLLGFVSISILVMFHLVTEWKHDQINVAAWFVFLSGFFLNEFILLLDGLFTWCGILLPYVKEGLLVASLVLAVGVAMLLQSFYFKEEKDSTAK